MFSNADVKLAGDTLGIDWSKTPLKWWRNGINVELEHGKIHNLTNVTNDDLMVTAKIAMAHILEDPNYYQKLEKMELGTGKCIYICALLIILMIYLIKIVLRVQVRAINSQSRVLSE